MLKVCCVDLASEIQISVILGFHLLMNVGQHEYITSVGKQAGAVVVVHDQSRMPFPEDEGILAVPGHVTSVQIRKVCFNGKIANINSHLMSHFYGII